MDSIHAPANPSLAAEGTEPPAPRPWMHGPLPEVIGYVGGALVASAGLNFVVQSWEKWPYVTRVSVVATAALLLYAAAGALVGISGGRRAIQSSERVIRRRLTAVLMALAATLVGTLALVVLDDAGLVDSVEGNPWLLLPGGLALTAAAIGAWLAPGVVSTLAVAGTAAWAGISFIMSFAGDRPAWWVPLLVVAFGALWLTAAPLLLRVPELSESLGMAWLLVFLGPAALADLTDPWMEATDDQVVSVWVSRALLAAIAIVALTMFARGASWAWAVGGVSAAAMAALGFAGQALGWVAALLVAGVVPMALSGLLLLLRRRSAAPTP